MKNFLPSTLLVMERLKQANPELGDLNDHHAKVLTYFTNQILGLKYFDLVVDTNKRPKEIRILVRTEDGKPLKFRLKKPELLDQLYRVLQLPDYIVKINSDE